MSVLPADPRFLIVGTGAVGCSVGAWLTDAGLKVSYLTRGAHGAALAQSGLTVHTREAPGEVVQVPAAVAEIGDAPDADVLILAVKTYSLAKALPPLFERYGNTPWVVGLQNGIANQQILPKFFSRVVYGVIGYNAWVDGPGVIGCQRRGPLVLGSVDPGLAEGTRELTGLFGRAMPTQFTERIENAAHCKLIINLANSLSTLIDFPAREPDAFPLLQKLLAELTNEGIRAVQAAGTANAAWQACPWWLMRAGARLPGVLTRRAFRNGLRKMVINSLAQDVAHGGRDDTELDDLNGYLITLAERHGVKVPVNRTVYALCRERLGQRPFAPMQVSEVWARVEAAR